MLWVYYRSNSAFGLEWYTFINFNFISYKYLSFKDMLECECNCMKRKIPPAYNSPPAFSISCNREKALRERKINDECESSHHIRIHCSFWSIIIYVIEGEWSIFSIMIIIVIFQFPSTCVRNVSIFTFDCLCL